MAIPTKSSVGYRIFQGGWLVPWHIPQMWRFGNWNLINCKLLHQARVVHQVDNAIHRINHYPVDSVVCFVNTYPLDSDLSGGQHYPALEQPGPAEVLAL